MACTLLFVFYYIQCIQKVSRPVHFPTYFRESTVMCQQVVVQDVVMCMCLCVYIYISSLPLPVPAGHKGGASPGYLQRSRSDVDVNAATVAKQRHIGQVGAGRLTPGSYSSLGKAAVNRTRQRTNQSDRQFRHLSTSVSCLSVYQ